MGFAARSTKPYATGDFDHDGTSLRHARRVEGYAAAQGIDTANFSLLTGPETAIKDLLTQFGVMAEFEGDIINHTLTTLLIDENGKIIHRANGSAWESREFVPVRDNVGEYPGRVLPFAVQY